jgi:hypothetical protein
MKKIKIEFYFILYLAAIATLFAIASQRDKVSEILTEMLKDGGPPQLQISIPVIEDFTISTTPLVRNEEIYIKNKEKIKNACLSISKIERNGATIPNKEEFIKKVFIIDGNDSSSIKFKTWQPLPEDLGNYAITFIAKGTPQRSARIDSLLNELPDNNLKIQLQDTVTFGDLHFRVINKPDQPVDPNNYKHQYITLSIPNSNVNSIIIEGSSGKNNIILGWKQQIIIGGIENPNINKLRIIPNEGNAISISGTTKPNDFILSGKSSEKQNIQIEYSDDGQTSRADFNIIPVKGQFYSNPKIAYSGENYKFNGNFTNLDLSIDIECLLNGKPFSGNIGVNSLEIKDIPASYEGQKYIFTRKYMGMEIGEPFIVDIKPPKPPVIVSVKRENDILILTARAFGKTLEGKPNSPEQLFFIKGGNETTIIPGETNYIPSENYSEKTYQIRKKAGLNSIVQLKLKVIDKRHAESNPPRDIDY